jgi:hypothetical protein
LPAPSGTVSDSRRPDNREAFPCRLLAASRAAAFDDHLVKPADPEKLLDKLQRQGKER